MEAGIPAYPVRLPITTTIKEVREKYAHLEVGEETEDYVGLAGRVILARNGGKLCFATSWTVRATGFSHALRGVRRCRLVGRLQERRRPGVTSSSTVA